MHTTNAMAGEYLGVREGIVKVHPACHYPGRLTRELEYTHPAPLRVRVAFCPLHDQAEQVTA